LAKFLVPQGFPTLNSHNKVSHGLRIYDAHVPPRTQHLSSVSTEHTNLPHSYPHTRVTGYEPPYLYHHVLTTIHEPTLSWHKISWSTFASIRTNNTQKLH